jgi:hypothetical protein
VAELSAYCRKLDAERQAETDPLKCQSLGGTRFHAKAALFREWKSRERR